MTINYTNYQIITTPSNWDCDGFYIPTNRFAEQLLFPTKPGPIAVKYHDLQSATITMQNNTKYYCPGNLLIYEPTEVNWEIPTLTYEEVLSSTYPYVPNSIFVE